MFRNIICILSHLCCSWILTGTDCQWQNNVIAEKNKYIPLIKSNPSKHFKLSIDLRITKCVLKCILFILFLILSSEFHSISNKVFHRKIFNGAWQYLTQTWKVFLLELSELTDLDLGQIKFRENMLELVLFELFLKDLKTLLKLWF